MAGVTAPLVRARVVAALKANPEGLRQVEIAKLAGATRERVRQVLLRFEARGEVTSVEADGKTTYRLVKDPSPGAGPMKPKERSDLENAFVAVRMARRKPGATGRTMYDLVMSVPDEDAVDLDAEPREFTAWTVTAACRLGVLERTPDALHRLSPLGLSVRELLRTGKPLGELFPYAPKPTEARPTVSIFHRTCRRCSEYGRQPNRPIGDFHVRRKGKPRLQTWCKLCKRDYQRGLRRASAERMEPLVGFLYDLMRDHLPTGVVEKLAQVNEKNDEVKYSNEDLAAYARKIANRLIKER